MLLGELQQKSFAVLETLKSIRELSDFVDPSLGIPNPFRPKSTVKLIILGQDPTVKRKESRSSITVVLNLDKRDALWHYLSAIASKLQLTLEANVYATNLVKNFFLDPPASYSDGRILSLAAEQWIPIARAELEQFPHVPIIALGQPLLRIVTGDERSQVKHYWGYQAGQSKGDRNEFHGVKPHENALGRQLFPFPHQPSANKEFYRRTINDYLKYVQRFLRRAT